MALALLVLPAVTSPAWFPWVVGAIARHFGIRLDGTERVGWTRIRLQGLDLTLESARLRAASVDFPQPLAWLGRLAGANTNTPSVVVADWSIEILPTPPEPAPRSDPGRKPMALADALDASEPILDRLVWLKGPVSLTRGTVTRDGLALSLPQALLGPASLLADVAGTSWQGTIRVRRPAEGGFRLEAFDAPRRFALGGTLTRTAPDWHLVAGVSESTNRLDIAATFAPAVPLPIRAQIQGSNLRIPLPPEIPGLLRADVRGTWTNAAGSLALQLSGETRLPSSPQAQPVPVAGEIGFQVSPDQLRVETLAVDSDPVRLRLSQPVTLAWTEGIRIPAATLELGLRLDALSGGRAQGRIEGTVESLGPSPDLPSTRGRFALRGSGLGFDGLPLGSLEAEGTWDGALVRLLGGRVRFPGDATLQAEGEADLKAKELRRLAWAFEGVPPGVGGPLPASFPSLQASGTVQGPVSRPVHQGTLRTLTSLHPPGWHPLELKAGWNGSGPDLQELTVSLAPVTPAARSAEGAEGVRAQARLRTGFDPASRTLTLHGDALEVRRTNGAGLTLSTPFAVRLRLPSLPSGTPAASAAEVELDPLRLQGPDGTWHLAATTRWPRQGRFELAVDGGRTDWLSDWRPTPIPGFTGLELDHVAAQGRWDDGPVEGSFDVRVAGSAPELGRLRVHSTGSLDARGLRIDALRLERTGPDALTLSAGIPWVLQPARPAATGWVGDDAELRGDLQAPATAWVWDWIAERTGIRPADPALRVQFSGTAAQPLARVELDLGRTPIPVPSPGTATAATELPPVDSATLRAHLTREAFHLDQLTVSVAGQQTRLSGRLPWPPGSGPPALPRLSDLEWRQAEARLEVPQADLAPFLNRLPELLHPAGALRADVRLDRGRLDGWLEVAGLSSRPRDPVGAIRDLELRVAFQGERASIERGRALWGGQAVSLSGTATVPGGDWSRAQAGVRVEATNVAVVRTPQALVRADLDLGLDWTDRTAPPQVKGTVTLHDSVVMLDVRDLVGVDLDRPERRPPYFSVDAPPVADWGLDLKVRGRQFARVLSPAFRGTVSADLQLVGTLKSPRLLGEAMADRGQIVFPFGQLQLSQARIRFNDVNPYQPVLEGRAEGMNFGYTVALEIGGSLDRPLARFDSVPPMSTREVLQMLTAGSLPNREYTYSAAAKAQNVGAYLAGDLLSSLTGNPAEESRLTLRSGQRVSTAGRLTYGVEYRLSERWSLVGEYDRWSQFNAGVRWRILDR